MLERITVQLSESIKVKQVALADEIFLQSISKSAELITAAYRKGFKTLIAGNGGSAADAQHMAGEFVSRFYFDRPPLSSVALSTDTSVLTAIGNDYGYEFVFSRQVFGLASPGDVFIGITTSGRSKNIIAAARAAKERSCMVIGLTGESVTEFDSLCDVVIKAPSRETPRVQEVHLFAEHMICELVEKNLFGEN